MHAWQNILPYIKNLYAKNIRKANFWKKFLTLLDYIEVYDMFIHFLKGKL